MHPDFRPGDFVVIKDSVYDDGPDFVPPINVLMEVVADHEKLSRPGEVPVRWKKTRHLLSPSNDRTYRATLFGVTVTLPRVSRIDGPVWFVASRHLEKCAMRATEVEE